ncbi:E3 ubiquitin-protein ligase TRIM35-like [Periophthalmus magnuspinnatus]|uniref:E3 ubiquitin-protein ligase TRIM35-like n=1 Tax=Periophthalmus magnuspinnatus TaxID=409849 RepID=UPI00145AA521|nr:E3 ubiquitin-protein ligase TRIM35-like [Periophthalmus magnuspinnatus]
MASRLEEELICSICHELFKDPVVLSCSHSFCKVCLKNWWRDKLKKTCPVCQRDFPPINRALRSLAPRNLALRNLVQKYEEQREQNPPLCKLHSERLRIFCLDHEEPVCLVCRDSRTHTDHKFSPLEEAAEDLREKLRRIIRPLQDKLQVLTETKQQFEDTAAHITAQARHTEAQIRDTFDKLHQFLLEEEDTRMKALREEEEQKTQRMKDKMAAVSRDMETLSKTIAETEEQLIAIDISFLLHYKSTLEMVQRCPLVEDPKMEHRALINQVKHLGNLSFHIWRAMKTVVRFYPIVLDPNRAYPGLILSEDLSSVKLEAKQWLPQNPERPTYRSVAGSKMFRSGTHSWDVEVGNNKDWDAGVSGHVQRGDKQEHGCFSVCFLDYKYTACSLADTDTALTVRKHLQRVRVKLDLDRGTLTFSDPNTNTDLHTFTDTFAGGMTPYLSTFNNIPLKILPKDVTVKV